MERGSFVKSGVVRLPPGFRFHPTDQELVLQYLRRKVHSIALPASIIPDVDVCKSDPWDLPGEVENERYYFSTKEAKYPNGNRSNRATVSGYWKATGKDKPILAASNPPLVVGMKKTLVFYRGKPPHGSRTDWIMHEYRLLSPPRPFSPSLKKTPPQKAGEGTGDWVLCRIFLKKRNNAGNKNDHKDEEDDHGVVCQAYDTNTRIEPPVFYDFLARGKAAAGSADLNLPPPPAPCSSSSDSSAVTHDFDDNNNNNNNNNNNEMKNNEAKNERFDEREESSSCCNSFSYLRRKP